MITREELRACTLQENISLTETAEGWLYWFSKRGDKYLKDAAKLGYTEAILDLPIEIGQSPDRAVLLIIQKGVKELVKGCFVGFIEDEYDEKPINKLLISWK
jgi:hypothetical protein